MDEPPPRARVTRRLPIVLALAAALFAIPALTATNAVPTTHAGTTATSITGNALKPAACASVDVTNVVVGTNGGPARDLVLATAVGTTVRGRAAADCVLGGGGNDTVNGDAGVDVCLGGPGTDVFLNCETQIQ